MCSFIPFYPDMMSPALSLNKPFVQYPPSLYLHSLRFDPLYGC